MKLQDKKTLITGASQGFGLAVAKAFLDEGASVAICSRTARDIENAAQVLRERVGNPVRVLAHTADVLQPCDVEAFVTSSLEAFGKLDAVVCNAGVYGPMGPSEEVDWTEWERALDINIKGVVLTCKAVVPVFKRQGFGRIIIVSGGGATSPMPFITAYAASKAAVVRFAESLAGELKDLGIWVNSIAPGALDTRMLDEVLEAGPAKVGQAFYDRMLEIKGKGGTPLETGAGLCVHLASDASGDITGKLLSAVWDPWLELGVHAQDLRDSDIFTLRRIIPRDRGKNWG